jgi:hypothetical protein
MYNHGLLARFGHAGLAALIAPRPLLIEMGSQDGVMVVPRGLVDSELDRVAAAYRAAGAAHRFAVVRFDGPHRVDGPDAFTFLDRLLRQDR